MKKLLQKLFNIHEKRKELTRKQKYLKEHGTDSCCPRCKVWESDGNVIYTTPSEPDDGSDIRECTNCGHKWRAIFGPGIFINIDEDGN